VEAASSFQSPAFAGATYLIFRLDIPESRVLQSTQFPAADENRTHAAHVVQYVALGGANSTEALNRYLTDHRVALFENPGQANLKAIWTKGGLLHEATTTSSGVRYGAAGRL